MKVVNPHARTKGFEDFPVKRNTATRPLRIGGAHCRCVATQNERRWDDDD